jgi:dihydrofolate reductase
MRSLSVFNHMSVDGYFVDLKGDMTFARKDHADAEWRAFVAENAGSGGALLFGRVTYELMASYWPTPVALTNDPEVAGHMNALPKVVFSRTLQRASWANTTLVRGDAAAAIRKMKAEPGPSMAILGSGKLVAALAPEGVIDEYQVVVNPVVLGGGRTMFDGVREKLALRLIRTRAFGNGCVLLCYQPLEAVPRP